MTTGSRYASGGPALPVRGGCGAPSAVLANLLVVPGVVAVVAVGLLAAWRADQ